VSGCAAVDVGAGVVDVPVVVVLEFAAVVVSVGVVVGAGVVVVVVEDVPVSVSWVEPPASAADEAPSGDTGVPLPVDASAPLANGPAKPAAVNPPPARAERTARTARLRALFRGCIRGSRSSRGRPMFVVGAASPHSRDTPTGILIGSEP
jgi:hypothetical protein